MSDAPLSCPACGVLLEELGEQLDKLSADLANAEQDLRSKRRQIKRLQADRESELRHSIHYEDAMEVLEHWKATCHPGARELGGQRLALVIERLEAGTDRNALKLAATGYARFPFMVNGRRSQSGSPKDWHADATLIYRNAAYVDKGLKMAAAPTPVSVDALKPLRDTAKRELWGGR